MTPYIVLLMLFASSVIMALAWLGHVRFRNRVSFGVAVVASWTLVLPEYVLNVIAFRWGHEYFTGAAMASFNLCTGVLCVALVSRFVLGESLRPRQVVGFVLMAFAVILVVYE
jgi:uncharacterized protein (DUF486 family)